MRRKSTSGDSPVEQTLPLYGGSSCCEVLVGDAKSSNGGDATNNVKPQKPALGMRDSEESSKDEKDHFAKTQYERNNHNFSGFEADQQYSDPAQDPEGSGAGST